METMDVIIEMDAAGLLLTMPIIALAMQHERGYLAGLASDAINRMALERWDGGILWRVALPVGDCGHVPE